MEFDNPGFTQDEDQRERNGNRHSVKGPASNIYTIEDGLPDKENHYTDTNVIDVTIDNEKGYTGYSNGDVLSRDERASSVTSRTSSVHFSPDIPPEKDEDNSQADVEEDTRPQWKKNLILAGKLLALISILYFFIISLDLLSDGFVLLGGRVAGSAFTNNVLLNNPICGLMIGVTCTAFLQSSSTSTSIVIVMVSAGLLKVQQAIPIIMGANIGTSVTGILVSVSQAGNRENFERAFSAATVHDMFNWLTVITLLPVEIITDYLYHLTTALVKSAHLEGGGDEPQFLSAITEPLTNLIVQVDKDALEKIAAGEPGSDELSLLKEWCEYEIMDVENSTITPVPTEIVGVTPCSYLFYDTGLGEQEVGAIILVIALVLLITCLVLMVKVLRSMLEGSMSGVIQKTINANFPGKAAFLTGYVAILVGALITILVQSSSVVASALTPMVGLKIVTVERVYPMMLGANIGTTSTAVLAAFAASSSQIEASFQIAMCHLFFNLTGILIWYPIPFMRRVPLRLAKFLGRTTAQYRWFAVFYLIMMFFVIPLSVFLLSLAGWYVLVAVLVPIVLVLIFVGVVNVLQSRRPQWLPKVLRTWDFLPEWMRSLEPLDRQVTKMLTCCAYRCPCCTCCKALQVAENEETEMKPSRQRMDSYRSLDAEEGANDSSPAQDGHAPHSAHKHPSANGSVPSVISSKDAPYTSSQL